MSRSSSNSSDDDDGFNADLVNSFRRPSDFRSSFNSLSSGARGGGSSLYPSLRSHAADAGENGGTNHKKQIPSVRSSFASRNKNGTCAVSSIYPSLSKDTDSLYPDVTSISNNKVTAAASTLPEITKTSPLEAASLSGVAYADPHSRGSDDESSDLVIMAKDVTVETIEEEHLDRKPPARKPAVATAAVAGVHANKPNNDVDLERALFPELHTHSSSRMSMNSSGSLYPSLKELEEKKETSPPPPLVNESVENQEEAPKPKKRRERKQDDEGSGSRRSKSSSAKEGEDVDKKKKKRKSTTTKKKKKRSSSTRKKSTDAAVVAAAAGAGTAAAVGIASAEAAGSSPTSLPTTGVDTKEADAVGEGNTAVGPVDVDAVEAMDTTMPSEPQPTSNSGTTGEAAPPPTQPSPPPPSSPSRLSARSLGSLGSSNSGSGAAFVASPPSYNTRGMTDSERAGYERARNIPPSTTPGAVMIPGSRTSDHSRDGRSPPPGQNSSGGVFTIPPSTDNGFLSAEDRARKTAIPPLRNSLMLISRDSSSDVDSDESTNGGGGTQPSGAHPASSPRHPDDSSLDSDNGSSSNADMEAGIIKATMVDTSMVPEAEAVTEKAFYRRRYLVLVFVGLALIGGALGISLGLTSGSGSEEVFVTPSPTAVTMSPTAAPTETPPPTLEAVVAAGVLRCGVTNKIGFSIENQITKNREGFDIDLCRAVAAAVLGDPDAIETTVLSGSERFVALRNDEVDMLARVTTHTMERDVYEKNALIGFSFAAPYLYDGLGFGGVPDFVDCADSLTTFGECVLLNVCVLESTTHIDVLSLRLPMASITPVDSRETLYRNLIDGVCNVIAAEQFDIAEQVVQNAGFSGGYKVGANRFSKEPLALVVRERDEEWYDFVSWTFQSLLIAEQRGITQNTAVQFPTTSLFGPDFAEMYRRAVGAVGNYEELYARHLQPIVPREGLNNINMNLDTGLIYSFPFGSITLEGPEPKGGTMDDIRTRGKLRCGIIQRAGTGQLSGSNAWEGLDADYCRAIAAAVFVDGSQRDLVEFVEVTSHAGGLEALSAADVDVFAGGGVTYERDVLDPATGQGFTFTTPYFYYPTNLTADTLYGGTLSLVTRQDDPEFADFCNWMVDATFYAEELKITQSSSFRMPEVFLYGPACKGMLRHAIEAVGNYGEMYARSVEALFPRINTANVLNVNPVGPQQYPLPGLA